MDKITFDWNWYFVATQQGRELARIKITKELTETQFVEWKQDLINKNPNTFQVETHYLPH
jgi:hypothetical protein